MKFQRGIENFILFFVVGSWFVCSASLRRTLLLQQFYQHFSMAEFNHKGSTFKLSNNQTCGLKILNDKVGDTTNEAMKCCSPSTKNYPLLLQENLLNERAQHHQVYPQGVWNFNG